MTQSIDVRKILLKRGNTAENDAYTGPVGELTLDTEADTVRVHDGITAGGKSVLVTQLQLDAVTSNISTLANIDVSQIANAAAQATQINSITDGTALFGNILPSANVTYNLGSNTQRWKELWLSGSTIYLGNAVVSVGDGNLTVNGHKTVGLADDGKIALPGDGSVIGIETSETITQDTINGVVSQTTLLESHIEFATTGVVTTKRTTVTADDGVTTSVDVAGTTLEISDSGAFMKQFQDPAGPDNVSYYQVRTNGEAVLEGVQETIDGTSFGKVTANQDSVVITTNTGVGHNWTFDSIGNITLPTNTDFQASPAVQTTGIVFGDGTFQNTAYTGQSGQAVSTTKTWTNPNENVWRIEEYNGGVATAFERTATTTYSTSASTTPVAPDYITLDYGADPTIESILNNTSVTAIEVNGTTYTFNGGYGYGGGLVNFTIAGISYNPGDTVTLTYIDWQAPLQPVLWYDPANSPGGADNFRGAMIEYHAYCNSGGTVIGKIMISRDWQAAVSHEEVTAGSSELSFYEFWNLGDNNGGQPGKLYLFINDPGNPNRTDNQVWIQWTSKIFYGSEAWC